MITNNYRGTANSGKSSFNVSYITDDKVLTKLSRDIMSGKVITGQDLDSTKIFTENSQYLTAIKYFPIDLHDFIAGIVDNTTGIVLADKVTGYQGYEVPEVLEDQISEGVFENKHTIKLLCAFDFTNINNYSFIDFYRNSYKLWLPFYKYVDLELNKILGKYLKVYLDIDFSTGNTTYYLTIANDIQGSFNDEILINTYQFQMYLNIPIGRNSAQQQNLETQQRYWDLVLNTAGGLATAAIGVASANPIGAVIGATTAISTITQAVSSGLAMYNEDAKNTSIAGGAVSGDSSGWNCSRQCFILKIAQDVIPNYDEGFKHQIGRLLNIEKTLGDLTGMTLVGTAHLDGLAGATKKEIDEISKILASGVIL